MNELKQYITDVKKISKQLNVINKRIDSYITYFENLKNIYHQNKSDTSLHIHVAALNTIRENKKLFSKNFYLTFTLGNENFRFSFEEINNSFYSKQKSSNLMIEISNILDDVNKIFDIEVMKNDIQQSNSLYKDIKKSYNKIKTFESGFFDHVESITNLLKENINDTKYINDQNLIYFSFRADFEKQILKVIIKNSDHQNYFPLIIPELNFIKKQYLLKHKNLKFSGQHFVSLFKNNFFDLNKDIFNLFNISKDEITYSNNYFKNFESTKFYLETVSSTLQIKEMNINKVRMIAEKINFNTQLINF